MLNFRSNAVMAWLACLTLTSCSSTGIKVIDASSDFTPADKRLIAFSVDQSTSFPLRSLELVVLEDGQTRESSTSIRFDIDSEGPTLALYSLPASKVRFGALRFYAQESWWETQVFGPEIVTNESGLTYLGRISAHSVALNRYDDTGEHFPTSVKMIFEDASEEDIPRLYSVYELPPSLASTNAIPGSWGESEFTRLAFRPIPGRHEGYEAWSTGPVGPDLPASRTDTQQR